MKGHKISFHYLDNIRSKCPLSPVRSYGSHWPLQTPGRDDEKYYLTIIHDYRKATVFPLKEKSDVFRTFVRYQRRVEMFLDRKIKAARTDNCSEFKNSRFENLLDRLGIKHEFTYFFPQRWGGREVQSYGKKRQFMSKLRIAVSKKVFGLKLFYIFLIHGIAHAINTKIKLHLNFAVEIDHQSNI